MIFVNNLKNTTKLKYNYIISYRVVKKISNFLKPYSRTQVFIFAIYFYFFNTKTRYLVKSLYGFNGFTTLCRFPCAKQTRFPVSKNKKPKLVEVLRPYIV